jgi:hypothetical protein
MISLVTLVAVMFFLILIAFVTNVARITSTKMEVQNGADSLAYSAALVMARGMNGVTAANHAIGELNALVILHHALGGDEFDDDRQPDRTEDRQEKQRVGRILDTSWRVANNLKDSPFEPSQDVYDSVKTQSLPDAGATLYRSCIRLQRVLGWTYQALAFGELLWKFRKVPIVGPFFAVAGGTISTAALVFEKKVWLERKILEGLESLAGLLKSKSGNETLKEVIETKVIRAIYQYSERLVFKTWLAVRKVDEELRTANLLAETAVYPKPEPLFLLPAKAEPGSPSGDAIQVSQLTRATYPWVHAWRAPLLEAMTDWLLLARSAHYYRHYSDFYTYQKVRERKEDGLQMYVMVDYRARAKGTEPWAQASGSRDADRWFGIMGFALRDPPKRTGAMLLQGELFKAENRSGVMAYAQAMIYNANVQRHERSLGRSQAMVGWDTLNWIVKVPEIESEETIGTYYDGIEKWDRWKSPKAVVQRDGFGEPRVQLNWQAKLVPVSKLNRADSLPGRIGKIVRRLERNSSDFRTH